MIGDLVTVHHELVRQRRRLILAKTTPLIQLLLEITALDQVLVVE